MENTTNNTTSNTKSNGIFSVLYRTRLTVTKDGATILNLSMLFSIISLLSAPWLVIIGGVVALAMGYRFAIDRNGLGFDQSFDSVIRNAAGNVKSAVESVTDRKQDAE